MTETTERIIRVLKNIPSGCVMCYRDAALAAGLPPGGARQVARVLHSMSEKYGLPWWRVIRADGTIALRPGAGMEEQAARLREEGVEVTAEGKIKRRG
jgi:methylated-DNA-protein-cysteine methyltransferase-like protein